MHRNAAVPPISSKIRMKTVAKHLNIFLTLILMQILVIVGWLHIGRYTMYTILQLLCRKWFKDMYTDRQQKNETKTNNQKHFNQNE